ncbi:entericidin A/B family lipoprotein [Allosphingosinicella flava]|uniref:Type IV secretion system putative lipoprotein virB7 n=1 Tax=Allosphingosinicella flava TaxID=2771430 RepID=A0A7T2LLW2_9SPHN|nr:entericidin A/B family lipoprotein [Sphingosinicella flava]QPQ54940.1 entericidin A/B family lipoprotein [Sphingosinicella flava]
MIRKLTLALGLTLALAACNTIAGIGEDVQSVGETVSDAAD